jgi:[acyl-carrier-protein] S-malonyltransferase
VKTENAQPAILAASCAIMSVLNARLPLEQHVSFALGHSLGEFAALKTSGILNFEDAVKLVRLRGQAMAKAVAEFEQETAMYALVVEKGRSIVLIDEIEQFANDYANENDVVAVANHNSVGAWLRKLMVVMSSGDFGNERCFVEMYGSSTDVLGT